ncbi:MAG: dockerin type I domain-containing protein, partial [Candidatus Magasanikbacteria bacterium]|nr:dockerin type I domain-containing protein [Candidatus Magasanikbacteria bacterium]
TLITEIGVGNITGIKTKTDSIAWSDVTGLVTSNGLIKAKTDTIDWANITAIQTDTDTIAWADITAIKDKTDTIVWGDITTIKNNVATIITEIGTGNITAIKTSTDTIAWSDITGLVTVSGQIKAKTDTIDWANVTAIKTNTDTIAWADVTGIKGKTDTIVWGDITTIKSSAATLITEIGTGNIAAIKTKTDTIDWSDIDGIVVVSGNIKTKTDTIDWANVTSIVTKTDTIAWADITGVKAKTDTINWADVTDQSPWVMTMSDFSTITAGGTYLSTLTTVYNGTLTDSANLPTITLYDSSRNVVVSSVNMTRTGVGTYTYSYVTNGSAPTGVWESSVSATVETGKTLSGNDYWNITSATPQVIILSMNSEVVPSISANVRITNEGDMPYEYQYEWCVVSSVGNACGGGDDIFFSSAAKLINPGSDFDTTLPATVTNTGSYYFKVVVHYGTETSRASWSFIATSAGVPPVTPPSSGGGGVVTNIPEVIIPVEEVTTCNGADFNHDSKVNSIDFSILLAFWKTTWPFRNQCVDINIDKQVNSIDFSILMYQWNKK